MKSMLCYYIKTVTGTSFTMLENQWCILHISLILRNFSLRVTHLPYILLWCPLIFVFGKHLHKQQWATEQNFENQHYHVTNKSQSGKLNCPSENFPLWDFRLDVSRLFCTTGICDHSQIDSDFRKNDFTNYVSSTSFVCIACFV